MVDIKAKRGQTIAFYIHLAYVEYYILFFSLYFFFLREIVCEVYAQQFVQIHARTHAHSTHILLCERTHMRLIDIDKLN